jgi:hypothetical protein
MVLIDKLRDKIKSNFEADDIDNSRTRHNMHMHSDGSDSSDGVPQS